ncbi:MAG: hypothetical protein JSW11_12005 [Candidatus Heimdallarchaeota archaeon]|nr:MAG: hypothetical protein JSW11_12005 [Candidatus Heimdallarchaeota archaeon]
MSDHPSSVIRSLFLTFLFITSLNLVLVFSDQIHLLSQELTQNNSIPITPEVSIKPTSIYSNDPLTDTIHGSGEGMYQIHDSLIRITNSSLDTTNSIKSGNPTNNNDTFTVRSLDGYSWNTLNFQIQNVTATDDWRSIENETVDRDTRYSTTYLEVAQEFQMKEDYANITQISLFIHYIDVAKDGQIPHGNVSIFDDNSGEPGKELGTTRLEEAFAFLDLGVSIGPTWVICTLPEPINVTKGSYWLVLNDTGNQAFGYWAWFTQDDDNNENAGDWAAKASHDGSWVLNPFPAGDILSAIRVLPTNEDWDRLTYSSPTQIAMTYNTTLGNYSLRSFSFIANDTLVHKFNTNTSVLMTLKKYTNFTYLINPISGHTTFEVANNSIALWNLTFSTSKVKSNDLIRNRTIAIKGIRTDWNGSEIFWNDSSTPEYTTLTDNVNITWDGDPNHNYTYGNTSMVINASTLCQNVTWHIWFIAPNYLLNFNLSRDDSTLSLPYKAYITDTLNLNFKVELPGGNISYWIEYYGLLVADNTNFNTSHTTFSDIWDINASVDPVTTANGTYNLQAFWYNTDKTKVGTFTRTVDIIINTSLTTETDNTIVIGDKLIVKAFYKSIHNHNHIMNAPILCKANWTDDVYMNQLTDGTYNATFDTLGRNNGEIGLINISTQMKWFVNWTITLSVEFVLPSTSLSSTSSETGSSTAPTTSTSGTLASSTTGHSTTSLTTTATTESTSSPGFLLIISLMLILSIFIIRRRRNRKKSEY